MKTAETKAMMAVEAETVDVPQPGLTLVAAISPAFERVPDFFSPQIQGDRR